jgi:hypothetical protein
VVLQCELSVHLLQLGCRCSLRGQTILRISSQRHYLLECTPWARPGPSTGRQRTVGIRLDPSPPRSGLHARPRKATRS